MHAAREEIANSTEILTADDFHFKQSHQNTDSNWEENRG